MTIDGKEHVVEEVLAASAHDDLAIVKISGTGFSPASTHTEAVVGEDIVVTSHPQGRFYRVTEGIISRYYKLKSKRVKAGADRLSITADFARGSSGSPVFSVNGGIIGVLASINSIYYRRDEIEIDKSLQMVIKSCVPSSAIMKLAGP